MTSVNLVSPEDNGHLYSVRFKEPLIIEPSSKVNLNFAKFKRNGNIFFNSDQTITLSLLGAQPPLKPVAPFNSNMTLDNDGVITIPKINPDTGKAGYSVLELDNRIKTSFDALQLRDTDKPTQFFHYTGVQVNEKQKNLIRIGYSQLAPQLLLNDITLSTADVVGGAAANNNAYEKTSAAAPGGLFFYDNYALSQEHYNFNYNSPDTGDNRNLIHFRCNRAIDTWEQAASIGLYSKEIADSTWTASQTSNTSALTKGTSATGNNSANGTAMTNPAIFTAGTTQMTFATRNLAASVDAVLGAYITFEITGAGGGSPNRLNIYMKTRNVANQPHIANLNDEFKGMKKVFSQSLSAIYPAGTDTATAHAEFAIETYWMAGNGRLNATSGGLSTMFFRVYNMIGYTGHSTSNLVWDSRSLGRTTGAIQRSFFTNNCGGMDGSATMTGTNAQKINKINASLPFNLIMSAQKLGEGFEFIRMCGFKKTDNNATAQNPHTFIARYKMKFSEELANYVGVGETPSIDPNTNDDNVESVSREEAEIVRDTSYSIYLKNLPIKCYKNIQKSFVNGNRNSVGFVQPILYDVPTPFADSEIVNMGSGDIIIGTFQPSINKILDLDNNKMVINNLDVEIRDTITNELSNELSGSVINFTITKP